MKKIITMALLMCLGYVVAQATTYKYSGRVGFDQIGEIVSSSPAWRIARGKLFRSRIEILVGNSITEVYADTQGELYLVDKTANTVYGLTDMAKTFVYGYMLKLYPKPHLTENTNWGAKYLEYSIRPCNLPQLKIKAK